MTANQREERKSTTRMHHRTITVAAVVIALIALPLLGDAFFRKAYAHTIFPGITVGGERVGGTSIQAARDQLKKRMQALEGEGLVLRFNNKDLLLDFTLADTAGLGLAVDFLDYDLDASVRNAYAVGRRGPYFQKLLNRSRTLLSSVVVQPSFQLDRELLSRALKAVLKHYEQPVLDPGYKLSAKGEPEVTPPNAGQVFDYERISREVLERVQRFSRNPIEISLMPARSSASTLDAESALPTVRSLVNNGHLKLVSEKKTVSVKPKVYLSWLRVSTDAGGSGVLGVSHEMVAEYLMDISADVSNPAKEAKFLLQDGKVSEFQTSSPGSELDINSSVVLVEQVVGHGMNEVALVFQRVEPQATAENISNLGIVEKVAEGRTNFSGSPVNRRHNIKIGADLLNGLLIKPGDEFSLIKAIGPVDATLGYRQELVIKENRTIPEFGGGLCQIGTTFFRLVLNAGLPILERKNHSYRVRYYEPPVGMDATVYEPKPDFRFRNDYGHYLLLQTRIAGDELIFEFWGTKDGRSASTTTPRVFNVVPPSEQLNIETTDLPAGTTKCTEKAHIGSDAEFTYTVTFPDGRKVDQVYKSHYKPWRAVCFVGVKSLSPKKDEVRSKKNETDQQPSGSGNENVNDGIDVNQVL